MCLVTMQEGWVGGCVRRPCRSGGGGVVTMQEIGGGGAVR